MAARAIGTSTIAFGLVSLPVKIYSTGESSRKVSFNMIWKERGVRVRQQYIDPADGTVVPKEEIVKGYEFAKGQYVLFTKEELEVVEAPKSDEIEIVSFVPQDTVDRLFFNKAYYLGSSRRHSERPSAWPSPSMPRAGNSTSS
jgi:DNA end-binding protein Ku